MTKQFQGIAELFHKLYIAYEKNKLKTNKTKQNKKNPQSVDLIRETVILFGPERRPQKQNVFIPSSTVWYGTDKTRNKCDKDKNAVNAHMRMNLRKKSERTDTP